MSRVLYLILSYSHVDRVFSVCLKKKEMMGVVFFVQAVGAALHLGGLKCRVQEESVISIVLFGGDDVAPDSFPSKV